MKPSLILDVRSAQEYMAGHLEGAINIPHDQLQLRIDSLAGQGKSNPVLVYCRSGVRSGMACSILVQNGFTQVMNGGAMATLLMNYKAAAPG